MRTVTNISTIVSLFGFLIPYFSLKQWSNSNLFQIICLGLLFISTIIMLIMDQRNKPKSYKTEKQINDYMYKWISNIGRIVIFTRDMSWTDERRIREKLLEKARNNELIICMPKANPFANELKSSGAKIVEYSNINYVPQSRFTIVHFERNDSKVAIGKSYGEKHIIEEFSNGQHPLFHVTQDLVNILINANSNGRKL